MAASSKKVRGKWRVRWRDRAGVQHWRTCPDRETAQRLELEIERAHALGLDWSPPEPAPARPGAAQLADVAAQYLRDRARTLAPRTLDRYGEALDLLLLFAGSRPIPVATVDQLSRALLAEGWDWLRDPSTGRHGRQRTQETTRKILEVWWLLWTWAHDHDEHGQHTPRPRRLETPRRPRPAPVAPTWADLAAMLAELRATAPDWTVRLALLARYLGERRTALLQLRWADLDLNRSRIVIPDAITKGGYGGRTIPLHPALVAELERWPRDDARLVPAPALELTGRGHCDRTVRRAWVRAGVPEERWRGQPLHAARKTIRTWMASQAIAPDVIDAYLGHAGEGSGGRYYTDRAQLWGALEAAVRTLPPHMAAGVADEPELGEAG